MEEKFSQLGNAFAILCNAAEGELAQKIAESIAYDDGLTKASLSMEGYIYDSLLLADKNRFKSYVLEKIDSEYGYMIDNGATTFWETLLGEKDFLKAGSLCHGWSALPIYY